MLDIGPTIEIRCGRCRYSHSILTPARGGAIYLKWCGHPTIKQQDRGNERYIGYEDVTPREWCPVLPALLLTLIAGENPKKRVAAKW